VDALTITIVLFAVGILLLVAEIFLPSHALMSIAGLALLVFGIARVFKQYGDAAGLLSLLATLIAVPTLAVVSIKYWHRTPLGRRISPPNPVVRKGEAFANDDLQDLIGRFGRAVTPLRPVGSCDFGGRKVECVAESSMIETETVVEAVALQGRTLIVRPKPVPDQANG